MYSFPLVIDGVAVYVLVPSCLTALSPQLGISA